MYFDTSQVYGCSIYLLHNKGGMASSRKFMYRVASAKRPGEAASESGLIGCQLIL